MYKKMKILLCFGGFFGQVMIIWSFCRRSQWASFTLYLCRWCCRWNAGEADLPHASRSPTRSPPGRCSPELAACAAPSWGLCWAQRPPGGREARLGFAGGRQWRRDSRPTPPAPQPGRWGDKGAARRGDEARAVWAEKQTEDTLRSLALGKD